MRFVVYGAGAIGGVIGARLHQAGAEVVLIARGAHRDAIAADGLTLLTPDERVTLPIPVASAPSELEFGPGDVVLLTVKGQDTETALDALRERAGTGVAVVCMQNGVENERIALRRFERVYGAVVMSPTTHLEPGVVLAYGTVLTGSIDVGRYPRGVDDTCAAVCAALAAARYESSPREAIMRYKHAKLLSNLGNAVQAVCGHDAQAGELLGRVAEEGETVLRAAGIEYQVPDVADISGRWERWKVGEIEGHARAGGSSWQSVVRGSERIETDFLNGEIVLRGRQLGIATPANALLQELAWETVRGRRQPGWLTPAQVLARL